LLYAQHLKEEKGKRKRKHNDWGSEERSNGIMERRRITVVTITQPSRRSNGKEKEKEKEEKYSRTTHLGSGQTSLPREKMYHQGGDRRYQQNKNHV